MNAILSLGRWLYAVPFVFFGINHLFYADEMSAMVPAFMPLPKLWIILTGVGMLAAAVSMVSGKFDKLGATLLGIMLLILGISVHLPNALSGADLVVKTIASNDLMKTLALAGGAFLYARHVATDRSIIN